MAIAVNALTSKALSRSTVSAYSGFSGGAEEALEADASVAGVVAAGSFWPKPTPLSAIKIAAIANFRVHCQNLLRQRIFLSLPYVNASL